MICSQQFDIVIEGVKGGQPADLSEMPPPPYEIQAQATEAIVPDPPHEEAESQTASPQPQPQPPANATTSDEGTYIFNHLTLMILFKLQSGNF